ADVSGPAWATEVRDGWTWVVVDEVWERYAIREFMPGVEVGAVEHHTEDGATAVVGLFVNLYVGPDLEDPGEVREVADALYRAADVLQGAQGRERQAAGELGSAGSTQTRVCAAIRARIAGLPIGQNEVAVAAGYGPDELSALMCGRRAMDLIDLERLARALRSDPFALISEAADAELVPAPYPAS
ncbi:MAG: helix-turn-helix transcriptional regulator, partial [Actinobacteria bacterium]|nr:helix-turn-helix transcriptional regulator [Actinomycetota bacterium]